jgi:endonuclease/exonuclease/phosphatase (EEP) superfamily protein YafD
LDINDEIQARGSEGRPSALVRATRWQSLLASLLVVPVAAWALTRTFGLERGFPAVAVMAFTPFAVPAALGAGLLAAALRVRVAALVGVASAVVLAAAVAPRVFSDAGTPLHHRPPLTVMTVNAAAGDASPAAIAAMAARRGVDVVSVQELTPALADALPGSLGRVGLRHAVVNARDGPAGTGLYSRTPLSRAPPPAGTKFAMTAAHLQWPGGPRVRVVSVHAAAPLDGDGTRRWRDDLRALPSPSTAAKPATLLAGDFNATLDHRELRRLLDRGYRDAADATGQGLHFTWPEGARLPLSLTIDHILIDREADAQRVSVHAVPGSDHRAVIADLLLPAVSGPGR